MFEPLINDTGIFFLLKGSFHLVAVNSKNLRSSSWNKITKITKKAPKNPWRTTEVRYKLKRMAIIYSAANIIIPAKIKNDLVFLKRINAVYNSIPIIKISIKSAT